MNLLRSFLRKVVSHTFKPALEKRLARSNVYRYQSFSITILPGVFHPAFFFSTKFLLSYLKKNDFSEKKIVEIGAGNGLIALYLSTVANSVVAVELSDTALKGLLLNANNNKHLIPKNSLKIVKSNLFNALEPSQFDYIVVNPPYFPKTITKESELAWNCGENHEYFKSFFKQAPNYMHEQSKIIMVLSDLCNIEEIKRIAIENKLSVSMLLKRNYFIEDNFIFEFSKKNTTA